MAYQACGKEVLRNGEHFADAVDNDAAKRIVSALNDVEQGDERDLDTYSLPFSGEEIDVSHMNGPGNVQGTRHLISRENDEFACSCGMRWDACDGEEHP